MADIVGIHGIGNHDPSRSNSAATARLQASWLRYLRSGFGDSAPEFNLSFAYYAPHLAVAAPQGIGWDAPMTESEQAVFNAVLRSNDSPGEFIQGRATIPVRQGVAWLAAKTGRSEDLMNAFVRRFCAEVSRYFDPLRASSRCAIQTEFAALLEVERPRVVIAHSLGSVVAYETLWSHPSIGVDLLLTLGSPLALPTVVREKLEPRLKDGSEERPPNVKVWANMADPGDVVAVPRWLGRYFKGIALDLESPVGSFDFHHAKGYLSSPTTAAMIFPQLMR